LNLEDDGKPLVGWIARVTGVKNPMRALEVADALPDTRFVMAGGGDLLEQVRAAAPANVTVLGWAEAADPIRCRRHHSFHQRKRRHASCP
jgi:glycosyltransferase involved in cell wall biosynthesis